MKKNIGQVVSDSMTVVFQINPNDRIKLADEGYAKFISGKFKQALSLIHTFTPRTNNNYKHE